MHTTLALAPPLARPDPGTARPAWLRALLSPVRRRARSGLGVARGHRVLAMGCTASDLRSLASLGADVTAVEPDPGRRARLAPLAGPCGAGFICLDPQPYGHHARYRRSLDRVLACGPLDAASLDALQEDLVAGGAIAAVDVLDVRWPISRLLGTATLSGAPRVIDLQAAFPRHRLEVHGVGLGRAFLFTGWSADPVPTPGAGLPSFLV